MRAVSIGCEAYCQKRKDDTTAVKALELASQTTPTLKRMDNTVGNS